MAEQREGWPMGLQPLNSRVSLVRVRDFSGSVSFDTLITSSPSSSADASSDLDTESTRSFFHGKSITLGSLIGISSILESSRRSTGGRKPGAGNENESRRKSRRWFFSLCSRNCTDGESVEKINAPSLAHFLAVERRAASEYRETQSVVAEPNSLFVDGRVAPPQTNHGLEVEKSSSNVVLELFLCMCSITALSRTVVPPLVSFY